MKLRATMGALSCDIEIRCDGERVVAIIDGRSREADVRELGSGNFVLVSDSRVFDCRVEGRAESGQPLDVLVGTERHTVTLTDPKRLRGGAVDGGHADGAARIIAPMPGKVVRLLAAVGDEIQAGGGIAVVEAMKMQNEMKSPKAGKVAAVNVTVGATVNGGDVLAIIE